MDEVTLPQAAEPAALWEHPCYVSCRLPSLIARATVGVACPNRRRGEGMVAAGVGGMIRNLSEWPCSWHPRLQMTRLAHS